MKKFLTTILSLLFYVMTYAQTTDNYLPSPDLAKLNGTWVGSFNGYNLKLVISSKKRYIKDADYSTDLLEGNFAFSRRKAQDIQVDTTVTTLREGHFISQEKKGAVIFLFFDKLKNKSARLIFYPTGNDSDTYGISLVNRYALDKIKAADTTFSIPKRILLKRMNQQR